MFVLEEPGELLCFDPEGDGDEDEAAEDEPGSESSANTPVTGVTGVVPSCEFR